MLVIQTGPGWAWQPGVYNFRQNFPYYGCFPRMLCDRPDCRSFSKNFALTEGVGGRAAFLNEGREENFPAF